MRIKNSEMTGKCDGAGEMSWEVDSERKSDGLMDTLI